MFNEPVNQTEPVERALIEIYYIEQDLSVVVTRVCKWAAVA